MSEPLVCAIMLTRDRPQMASRAVRAFREQTYQNKVLFVLAADMGKAPVTDMMRGEFLTILDHSYRQRSIGELRNLAHGGADAAFGSKPAIFITFDDDDVSHERRIEEQVAQLQASGADVVAYNEILFWRTNLAEVVSYEIPAGAPVKIGTRPLPGEAWLYRNPNASAGSSFCYWRKTWEHKPFPDVPVNEDSQWARGLEVARCSSLGNWPPPDIIPTGREPRLICSIHGGNTLDYDIEGMIARGAERNWIRVPAWDAYARERMAL